MLSRPLNKASMLGPTEIDWWKNWQGRTVAIVASGPSAQGAGVDQLHGQVPVIAVNESWRLCPWADVLYGCDGRWWKKDNYAAVGFAGLKLTFDAHTVVEKPEIKKININVDADRILVEKPTLVGSGGSSGFQALNLAVQFGAVRILLVGFDMRVDMDAHWHGRHPPPLTNPTWNNYTRWISALDGAFEALHGLCVTVINCSSISALTTYPKMSIREALG